jgi:hypothetical protein
MKIGKFLKESILWENLDADVLVETGDYGPCVEYNPATKITTRDEDDWVDEGTILIDSQDDKPTMKVSELVDQLGKMDMKLEVEISDGYQAAPFLINSYEEFARHEQGRAGYPNGCTAADEEKEFPNLKFPIIIIDTER